MKLNILNPKIPENLDELKQILLENRGFKTKKEIDEFLSPKEPIKLIYEDVGIDTKQMKKAIKLIGEYIKNKHKIVIYSDYDADGICAGSILWQALYSVGADAVPFIPSREEDGYGLSVSGIDKILALYPKEKILIITVDNGIVANEAAEYLPAPLQLIITDHHVKNEKIPKCDALIHTTNICGAGVAWFLAKEIFKTFEIQKNYPEYQDTLDLLTIATVADMVPLTNFNRQIVKHGFQKLKDTRRVGLLEIFKEAVINPEQINTHTIGFVIGPRINAMGRLTNALNSFRLLCTRDVKKAEIYAKELGATNRDRQNLTFEQTEIASYSVIKKHEGKNDISKILIEINENFNLGVIGLIAGRLMEKYHRPAIVIARGEKVSKASVRSIAGFNIIEHLRKTEHLLINCGGHPMAAGFTIETEKIEIFKQEFLKIADESLTEEILTKKINVDCILSSNLLTTSILKLLNGFSPFGMTNPEPVFLFKDAEIISMRTVGRENQHLKLAFKVDGRVFEGIGFSMAQKHADLKLGTRVSLIFTISENNYNGRCEIQVKIKDIVKM
jgi:single-stranded-DNA-specific exonuclease